MSSEAHQLFDRALEYERAGNTRAALATYLKAIEGAPDDMIIAYRTATALLREGHLDEALSQLRRIVFVEPDNLPARANLGNCQYLLRDYENAEKNFREVLEIAPNDKNALFGLSSVLLEQNKTSDARKIAEHLMELLPNSAPVHTIHAQCLAREPQISTAVAAYRKALSLDGAYEPALTGLANIYVRNRRFSEAAILASQAHNLRKKAIEPLRLLAEARKGLGDFDGAQDALLKAISLAPNSEKVGLTVQLCQLLRKRDMKGEALAAAYGAYQLDPTNAECLNALGACLASLGHGSAARTVLTASARKEPLPAETVQVIEREIDQVESLSVPPGKDSPT